MENSLYISNLIIILLKNQLLQFLMYLIHNFLLKIYYLKCLKSVSGAFVNISRKQFTKRQKYFISY